MGSAPGLYFERPFISSLYNTVSEVADITYIGENLPGETALLSREEGKTLKSFFHHFTIISHKKFNFLSNLIIAFFLSGQKTNYFKY